MELDDETVWISRAVDTAQDFAKSCRKLCGENPSELDSPLTHIMNDAMTELWDSGFSQTEIRDAFIAAIDDLERYAAGEEKRS